MLTIGQHIQDQQARFSRLSDSRQAALAREARREIARHPHMADSSTFWRGLSARQVLAAYYRA